MIKTFSSNGGYFIIHFMGKETFYFSHDYNSRTDEKIKKLLAHQGYAGYGLFWAIIEDLYNNENRLKLDFHTIAFDLRSDKETIKSIISDFELFEIDGDFFKSLSVEKRVFERREKSKKASESANKRWKPNANALPTHCAPNAIKESKGKEIKENNKKEEEKDFEINYGAKLDDMIVKEMMDVWKRYKPKYKSEIGLDYTACLDIAYFISEDLGIEKNKVVSKDGTTNLAELLIIQNWEEIIKFVLLDSYFGSLTISGISNKKNWQSIQNKMIYNPKESKTALLEKDRILPENYFEK